MTIKPSLLLHVILNNWTKCEVIDHTCIFQNLISTRGLVAPLQPFLNLLFFITVSIWKLDRTAHDPLTNRTLVWVGCVVFFVKITRCQLIERSRKKMFAINKMSANSVISVVDPTPIACHNGSQPIVASYTNYVVISCSGSKDTPSPTHHKDSPFTPPPQKD